MSRMRERGEGTSDGIHHRHHHDSIQHRPAATYRVDLEGPDVGERHGASRRPTSRPPGRRSCSHWSRASCWRRPTRRCRPRSSRWGISPAPETAGGALGGRPAGRRGGAERLRRGPGPGRGERRPLPVEMRFGAGCDALAALPWELLHYRDRFLVADTSIALCRYPEGAIPPTAALAELPLRVLLVLSEPADASPIFPRARARSSCTACARSTRPAR